MYPVYVSCGFDKLYRSGDFPGSVEELRSIEGNIKAGKFICELFPAYEYKRHIDADHLFCSAFFLDELQTSRKIINCGRSGSASALFLLSNVLVRDRVIYLNDQDIYPVVYETHRPIDRQNSSLAKIEELQNATPALEDDAIAFFLGSTGCFNYGHWLVDDLSRIAAFWKVRELNPRKHITVVVTAHSGAIDIVKKQSIEFMLSQDENFSVRLYPRPGTFSFKNIYFASPTTVHSTLKSPDALNYLRSSAVSQLGIYSNLSAEKKSHVQSQRGMRLFIDRGPSRSRNLRNSNEIFSRLEKMGFRKYTLEDVSFVDQVALFSGAEMVVGNMGAGMTNTLFCKEGTPILNLAPEGWDEPFFWDLATVMKQKHFVLYGPFDGMPFASDYAIDPEAVVEGLHKVVTANVPASGKILA